MVFTPLTGALGLGPGAGSGSGMGTRTGVGRAGNGTGISSLNTGAAASESDGVQFDDREYTTEVIYSGSDQDQDSDSGDDEDTAGSGGDRRGVKRERRERGVRHQSAASGGLSRGYGGVSPVAPGAKPGKKTRGRVKIKMEFIDNKLRRYTTFSKRKTGIMKKVSVEDPDRGHLGWWFRSSFTSLPVIQEVRPGLDPRGDPAGHLIRLCLFRGGRTYSTAVLVL